MPWCPRCRVEYRPGYDVCRDCGELLEPALEPGPRRSPALVSGPRAFGETTLVGMAIYAGQFLAWALVVALFNAAGPELPTRTGRLYWLVIGLVVAAGVTALAGLAYGHNRPPRRVGAALLGYLAGAAASWAACIIPRGVSFHKADAAFIVLHVIATAALAAAATCLGRAYALGREAEPLP